MSSNYLLIIITRIDAKEGADNDEFTKDWRQDPAVESVRLPENSMNGWTLLLIHGYSSKYAPRRQTAETRFGNIIEDVRKQLADQGIDKSLYSHIYVFCHAPESTLKLTTESFKEIIDVKAVRNYSTENPSLSLLTAINDLVPDKKFFNELTPFLPRYKQSVLNSLRHELNRIFMPLSIDLQGLQETRFDNTYWREIVEAYTASDEAKPLSKARRIMYGQEENGQTIKGLVNQLGISGSTAWGAIKALLPEADALSEDASVLSYFENQECLLNKREAIRDSLNKEQNFFGWYAKLEKALNTLAKEVEDLKNPLS